MNPRPSRFAPSFGIPHPGCGMKKRTHRAVWAEALAKRSPPRCWIMLAAVLANAQEICIFHKRPTRPALQFAIRNCRSTPAPLAE
jgi:hypothetical protein